jgi:hypothetical protein
MNRRQTKKWKKNECARDYEALRARLRSYVFKILTTNVMSIEEMKEAILNILTADASLYTPNQVKVWMDGAKKVHFSFPVKLSNIAE